ncbi:TPA: hypothetical protein ACGN81_005236 [Bacillus cereus]
MQIVARNISLANGQIVVSPEGAELLTYFPKEFSFLKSVKGVARR